MKTIKSIRTAMMIHKLSKAILLYDGGVMKLYERSGVWDALPSDLLSKWA